MDALFSTDWLERELGASDLRVVDATKFLGADRDARAEYEAGHIPGAVFMDLAALTDASNAVENMAPSAEKFASRLPSLGIGDCRRIVPYHETTLRSLGSHRRPLEHLIRESDAEGEKVAGR